MHNFQLITRLTQFKRILTQINASDKAFHIGYSCILLVAISQPMLASSPCKLTLRRQIDQLPGRYAPYSKTPPMMRETGQHLDERMQHL